MFRSIIVRMQRTDYERIADRYDENPVRSEIAPDDMLGHLVAQPDRAGPVRVLDVGAGTGNWLAVQAATFGREVALYGVEPSAAMLARARAKLPETVTLVAESAENLPFEPGSFAMVVSTFAFHHFEDKRRSLDEMTRVLDRSTVGARLRLRNVDPARMRAFWGYRYFPESWLLDELRFWSAELLAYELERRGGKVETRIDVRLGRCELAAALVEAERRDVSQLAAIDDAAYQRGLCRLRDELAADPQARIDDALAIATWTAAFGA
jgi:ubiquinone/menaquinone biosynthesis C-methylase UbiE